MSYFDVLVLIIFIFSLRQTQLNATDGASFIKEKIVLLSCDLSFIIIYYCYFLDYILEDVDIEAIYFYKLQASAITSSSGEPASP